MMANRCVKEKQKENVVVCCEHYNNTSKLKIKCKASGHFVVGDLFRDFNAHNLKLSLGAFAGDTRFLSQSSPRKLLVHL